MNKFSQHSPKTFPSFLRRTAKLSPLALGSLALVAASGVSYGDPAMPTGERLRDLGAASGIKLGAAIPNLDFTNPTNDDFEAVAKREFNFFTSENEMKFHATEPNPSDWKYTNGQRVVDLAAAAGGDLHGHTLVWWNLPDASYIKDTGTTWTATTLTNAMNNHIDNVGSHWGSAIDVWDVVNESFRSDSAISTYGLPWDQCMHPDSKDIWKKIIGPTYIEKAFTRARAAAPNAVLLYNDAEIEEQNKHSDAVYKMVQDFQGRATPIPIDGIGAQMHMTKAHSYRPGDTLTANFNRFGLLGMKTYITEFDCPPTILVPDPDNPGGLKPQEVSSPISSYALDRQARSYEHALRMALRCPSFSGFQTWTVKNNSGAPRGIFSTPAMNALPAYYAIQDALAYQQRDELVANGGVESGLTSWSGTANGTSTIAASTATAHSGTTSILVSGRTSGNAGPGQSVKTKLLEQGAGRYYMRAWVRTVSGTANAQVTLRVTDDNNTRYLNFGQSTPISTTWTEVSGWINVKWFKNLSSAVLYVETPGSTANFYVDDVTLSDGNLLKNGDFEDTTFANWGTYVGGSIANVGADTELDLVYKYGRKGGYVTGRANGFNGPAQNITSAMLASGPGSYDVSAWVKFKQPAAPPAVTDNARITIRTASGSPVSYKTTTDTPISSDKWTKISGTLNVTWSGALSESKLYIETPGNTTPLYVDEVIVRKNTGGSSSAAAASPASSSTGPSSKSS